MSEKGGDDLIDEGGLTPVEWKQGVGWKKKACPKCDQVLRVVECYDATYLFCDACSWSWSTCQTLDSGDSNE